MKDEVDRTVDEEVVRDVVPDELEPRVPRQMGNVLCASRDQIVDADDIMSLGGQPIAKMHGNLIAIANQCRRAGAKVLMVGMQLPPNYGPAYTEQFARTYPTVSEHLKLQLVPFFFAGIADNRSYFQADQLHPNAKAQPILLENVWAEIQPLLTNPN